MELAWKGELGEVEAASKEKHNGVRTGEPYIPRQEPKTSRWIKYSVARAVGAEPNQVVGQAMMSPAAIISRRVHPERSSSRVLQVSARRAIHYIDGKKAEDG